MQYPDVQLFIDGQWIAAEAKERIDVINPATGEGVGSVAHARIDDVEIAAAAAKRGFEIWRAWPVGDRSALMRRAADLLRERVDMIARLMTLEQGKPFGEAQFEVMLGAAVIDWFAEEARRTYGRVIPGVAGVYQLVIKEPVGVAAAFTPWNFPINQVVRKVAAGLAAGCSVIVKAPEETPASPAELIRVFADAGLPAGVVNLLYGTPAEISEYLIPHPVVRKISFTGSTAIGKQLAGLAGLHMKRATMELGGHAPAIVFGDADPGVASATLATMKNMNAGQVCISPTRFLVHESIFDNFVEQYVERSRALVVGDGLDANTQMGPLANERRLTAMETLVADAARQGAHVATGGRRIGNKGNFFEPTVITDAPLSARVMTEEPFGPLSIINRFSDFDTAIEEANRLPYGLAAYAFTSSAKTAQAVAASTEAGMVSINHFGLASPETPFGGVKDSGYGSEGGTEAMEAYQNIKFVSQANI
jgi:succinate-semialdehyde dehydrogenase/glutarate-semialdehyde dehydrogenase